MKQLLLVRHAKSSWDDASLADHERPLARRGLEDAPRIFQRLAIHGTRLDRVVSSDAVRALCTARLLADGLGLAPADVQRNKNLYLASVAELVDIIRGLDDAADRVALVGHNPGFTQLVNHLVADLKLDNLPTCGIAGISFACDSWLEAPAAAARLTYLDYPKNRKAPFTWS